MTSRERIAFLIHGREALSFSGTVIREFSGPCVYILFRGETVMYVGMSRRGLARPFQYHHLHVEETDQLQCWPLSTVEDAVELERLLIETLRPVQNRRQRLPWRSVATSLGISYRHAYTLYPERTRLAPTPSLEKG